MPNQERSHVHIPETVSPQAQAFLRTLNDESESIRGSLPVEDLAGYKEVQNRWEAEGRVLSKPSLRYYQPTITEYKLGGVPVFDIRPKDWTDNGKVLVHIHNSVRVLFSAAAMLGSAAGVAHETGLRVIFVNHTLAPQAKYNQMSDELVAAIRGLLDEESQRLENMAIHGAGSGGGLAAAVVLKMRDQGLGMPAAAVLVSPWLDVTLSGDTETTLRDADPYFLYHVESAAAYAHPKDQKDPYASPVYGDFSKGFSPTLIQGGLKETLLSGFVRFYQALDVAGVPVKLDLYEGMVSLFQGKIPNAPESIIAHQKVRAFLYHHLRCG